MIGRAGADRLARTGQFDHWRLEKEAFDCYRTVLMAALR